MVLESNQSIVNLLFDITIETMSQQFLGGGDFLKLLNSGEIRQAED
jgi:hypothetical protein